MEPQSPAASELANAQPPVITAGRRSSARLFVGIKIVAEIARELASIALSLGNCAVRLIPVDDIHLTLVPPWSEENIEAAAEALREALRTIGSLDLIFEHVTYGPSPEWPKFLWAECAPTNELLLVRKHLLCAFGQIDERPFRPHVTLARLGDNGRKIARVHPMDMQLSLRQRIHAIELFQSPQQQGRGYKIVASVPLFQSGTPSIPSCASKGTGVPIASNKDRSISNRSREQ